MGEVGTTTVVGVHPPPSTSHTLDESASKSMIAACGVPIAAESVVPDAVAAGAAADRIGYPVVVKLCGDSIAHKSERGLVKVGVRDHDGVVESARELLAKATPEDGPVEVLVAEMVHGNRDLIAGLHRDPQFGLTVMIGVGGVLAEAVGDVAFRLVPLTEADAEEMIDDLSTDRLFGEFRGEPAIDRSAVVAAVMGLAQLGLDNDDIASVDINPLIISDGRPVAVDALVEMSGPAS